MITRIEEQLKTLLAEQDEKVLLQLILDLSREDVTALADMSDVLIEKVALAYMANKEYAKQITRESWARGETHG